MSTPADRALALLTHLLVSGDSESNALLDALVRGWMTGSEPLGLIAYGDETRRPWQVLTDPAAAELWSLPHASQYTGGTLPARLPGETDIDYLVRARSAALSPAGMYRGAQRAITEAVRPHLTGQRRVVVIPAPGGDIWSVIVITYLAETPDQDAVIEAIEGVPTVHPGVVAAGIVVDYRVGGGWTIAELEAEYAGQTIADMEADFTTIGQLETRMS